MKNQIDLEPYDNSVDEEQETFFGHFNSFGAMYDSSYKVCRNVRWKDSVIYFEDNRLDIILNTIKQVNNNEYEQLPFNCFTVIERGKSRNIRACHINDRLVQNALCEQALLPLLTPKFVYDNCATLKGKGIDFAIKRMRKHLQDAHREYGFGNDFYGARIDISKYFDSINHEALKKMARKAIKEDAIYEQLDYFINTFSYNLTKDKAPIKGKQYFVISKNKYVPMENLKYFRAGKEYYEIYDKSLGLGSQTSQLMALLALNGIDHFIKEQLHIKYYGRYMDDLYLLHNDSQYLAECLRKIEDELQKIGLTMNPRKSSIIKIHPIKKDEKKQQPFKYLKWNFYLTDTNRIIQIPFKEKITKERKKLRKMAKKYNAGLISAEEIQKSYQGWRAHINQGNTFYILQDMDNYFRSLFKGVEIK